MTPGRSEIEVAPLTATAPPEPMRRLREYGEVVAAIGAWLELTPHQLAAAEALERLEVVVALAVERLAATDVARLAAWFDTLGTDLLIELRVLGGDADPQPEVVLRAGHD